MAEFDELVSRDGVIVAGRIGSDWRVAEYKAVGLFIEVPSAFEMMSSFCAAIQMTFNTMALAMTRAAPMSWEPLKGWAVSSGIYTFVMHGDRFVLAETDKVGSFDELRKLLQEPDS